MFSAQIGSILACRDECALEFALKVDRDAGGAYLGGTGGFVLGPRHVFVSAGDPVTVSLDALARAKENPLREGQTVLSVPNNAGKAHFSSLIVTTKTPIGIPPPRNPKTDSANEGSGPSVDSSLPWSSPASFIATLTASAAPTSSQLQVGGGEADEQSVLSRLSKKPANWMPSLNHCNWKRRNNMKADLEEAMGIDGVSFATYDQLKYAASSIGGASDGAEVGGKNVTNKKTLVKRTAPKRQRNSSKMLKSVTNRGKDDRQGAKKTKAKQRGRRRESSDDEDESPSLSSGDDDSVLDVSGEDDESVLSGEKGLYGEGVGGGSFYDDDDSDEGSVVEFSDGMEDDED